MHDNLFVVRKAFIVVGWRLLVVGLCSAFVYDFLVQIHIVIGLVGRGWF